jgi:hypothetical protein
MCAKELSPEEGWRRAFQQMWDLFVQPEVDRRDKLHLLPADFDLSAAQVIFPPGEPLFVRLNEEVIASLRGTEPSRSQEGGQSRVPASGGQGH